MLVYYKYRAYHGAVRSTCDTLLKPLKPFKTHLQSHHPNPIIHIIATLAAGTVPDQALQATFHIHGAAQTRVAEFQGLEASANWPRFGGERSQEDGIFMDRHWHVQK